MGGLGGGGARVRACVRVCVCVSVCLCVFQEGVSFCLSVSVKDGQTESGRLNAVTCSCLKSVSSFSVKKKKKYQVDKTIQNNTTYSNF